MTQRGQLLPSIDLKRCTGCGWCVAACPLDLLSLEREGWKKHSALHDAQRCTGCAYCAIRCPFNVITMQPASPAAENPATGLDHPDPPGG